ncbi:MAG: hypothetical protein WCV72_04705 [Patescibacteria group bacterium]|jgi:F0F1-type ATP synthase membrane subunit b/b'
MSFKSAFAAIGQNLEEVGKQEGEALLADAKARGTVLATEAKDKAVQKIAEKKDAAAEKISAVAQEKLNQVADKLPPQVVQSGAKLGSVAQDLTAKVDQVVPVSQTLQDGKTKILTAAKLDAPKA